MTEESGTSTAVLADSSNLPVLAERTIQDSSDEEVTLRKAAPEAKETVAAGAEEERVEPMIHHPLPIAFKSKSEMYRARQRYTHMNVENLKTGTTESIVHDRKQPSSQSNETAVMNAMVDLMSNSVVVVGGDRLGDALARQKLKEYKEYMEKRSQNLIRIPKSKDGRLKKGRWKN